MNGHVLVANGNGAGDVLLTGPAVRAVAHGAHTVTYLASPRGRPAAELLPGVDRVLEYEAPWGDTDPPPVTTAAIYTLIGRLRALSLDAALIFTAPHQSPLPLALVLRMAGIARIAGCSDADAGSLLDIRQRGDEEVPEQIRALSLAVAAGYSPIGHRLRIRDDLPDVSEITGGPGYIVVHPGAAAPARRMSPERSRAIVAALARAGHRVVVTGGPEEVELTAAAAGDAAVDLGGATDFAQLAAVLRGARVVVTPNTGPAQLAAASQIPIVSLFAPVVSAKRWAPYGVPRVVLGDQSAPCAGTMATVCPVSGHPCLESITEAAVVDAVDRLVGAQPFSTLTDWSLADRATAD